MASLYGLNDLPGGQSVCRSAIESGKMQEFGGSEPAHAKH